MPKFNETYTIHALPVISGNKAVRQFTLPVLWPFFQARARATSVQPSLCMSYVQGLVLLGLFAFTEQCVQQAISWHSSSEESD